MINKKTFLKQYLSCRRGMLELDIILIKFIENEYENLDKNFFIKFEELLLESDTSLYSYIILGQKSKKNDLNEIILKIRSTVRKINFKY